MTHDACAGLVALFADSPIVALVEAHWVAEEHGLLRELLSYDSSTATFDVVVEFGNAAHQDVLDRYLAGADVPPEELRRIWSECVGAGDGRVFESPLYADFFAAARASRTRVLLGDPPSGAIGRDEHFARVVAREVLVRGGRALLLAGAGHLARLSGVDGGNVVQRLERVYPGSCTVVLVHYVFADLAERRARELAELERRLASWPIPSLARIHDGWLADVDATLLFSDTAHVLHADGTRTEVPAPPFLDDEGRPAAHVTLGDVADAYLYLGPVGSLTLVPPPGARP